MKKSFLLLGALIIVVGCVMETPPLQLDNVQSNSSQQQTLSEAYELVKLWEYKIEGGFDPDSIAISLNGDYVAVAVEEGGLYLLNKSGNLVWSYSAGGDDFSSPDEVRITSNGELISFIGWYSTVVLDKEKNIEWTSESLDYESAPTIKDFDISEDGSIIAISRKTDGLTYFVDDVQEWLSEYNDGFYRIDMTPYGEYIVVYPATEESLFLFDDEGNKLWEYEMGDYADSISISDNGEYILYGNMFNSILIDNDRQVIAQYDFGIASMSSDGSRILGESFSTIYLFDNHNNKLLQADLSASDLKISPEGNYFALTDDDRNTVYLYEIRGT